MNLQKSIRLSNQKYEPSTFVVRPNSCNPQFQKGLGFDQYHDVILSMQDTITKLCFSWLLKIADEHPKYAEMSYYDYDCY